MISKETFVNIMNRLETLDTKMDKVDIALKELSHDFCGFYVPECIDIIMDVLHDIFNDKNNWLEYFVYDMAFLRKCPPETVIAIEGEPHSWGEVYDFLSLNMELDHE